MTYTAHLWLLLLPFAEACIAAPPPISAPLPISAPPSAAGASSPRDASAGPAPAPPGEPAVPGPHRVVSPGELVATSGSIIAKGPARFEIRSPVLRAELGGSGQASAELDFVYLGPTQHAEPLTSGELRRQIGLKLRAQDTCNVVYVMWHIEPSQGLRVSVKSNPGQSRHSECSDRGYQFLEPTSSNPVNTIRVGEAHQLRATLRGDELFVTTDGAPSWAGKLPPEALGFDGPVGLRSDNGDFDVALRVAESPAP